MGVTELKLSWVLNEACFSRSVVEGREFIHALRMLRFLFWYLFFPLSLSLVLLVLPYVVRLFLCQILLLAVRVRLLFFYE